MLDKPHAFNPPDGFIATANNNLTPESYPHRDAIGWTWADPYRWARISEVLGSGRRVSMMDMMRLQTDYASLPARALVPLVAGLTAGATTAERARRTLVAWDGALDHSSVGAGIFEAWFRHLVPSVTDIMVPSTARTMARGIPTSRIIQWLTSPGGEFGAHPTATRDSLLLASLDAAVAELTTAYGTDQAAWTWGRDHQALLQHPMSGAMSAAQRARFEVGPWPRGGDANTVGATGSGPNQLSGASFRFIVEANDWDSAVGINTPGQSGDVDSPHYRDLFELWKTDRYFPVKYSRSAVDGVTERRTILAP